MRLRLILLLLFAYLFVPASVDANQGRVTVRGNYYRETSNRVLAPVVNYRQEVLGEKLGIEVEYMLDHISSASIGAAAQELGGDKVFTEIRHEAIGRVASKLGPWSVGGFGRYSTETDYESRSFGVSGSRELRQRTITLGMSYSANLDDVYRITNNLGVRQPWCGGLEATDQCLQDRNNLMQQHYLGLGYTHVLTKRLLGGLNIEGIFAIGPQDNPYRRVQNGGPESHPTLRRRLAPSGFLAWSIPKTPLVLEGHYRYYTDDWKVRAHDLDARVHVRVFRQLRIRGRYRFYTQTQADFWRDDGNYPVGELASDDPKLDDFRSNTPGLELTWELTRLSQFRGLAWLDGAWIQANYNHVFVRCDDPSPTCKDGTTRYGNARIGNLSFSLAF